MKKQAIPNETFKLSRWIVITIYLCEYRVKKKILQDYCVGQILWFTKVDASNWQ